MILFVSENEGNNDAMQFFASQASYGGERVGFTGQSETPSPCRWAMELCKRTPEEIGAYQQFKDSIRSDSSDDRYGNRYGTTPEEYAEKGFQWYAHWCRKFQNDIYDNKVDHVVTWGSGVMGNRTAVMAAEDMGLEVTVLEDGWFPLRAGKTYCACPGRAYYEHETWPALWEHLREEHEFIPRRIAEYMQWWQATNVTKYTGAPKQHVLVQKNPIPLPEEWEESETPHTVWFGQVNGDAAMYFLVDDEAKAKLASDAMECNAWYKGHPFSQDIGEGAELRRLNAQTHLHQVLARTAKALVLTSNVGLEAWAVGKQVGVYGRPFYKRLIEECEDNTEAKMWALDMTIHSLQFHRDDHNGFVRMLKEGRTKAAKALPEIGVAWRALEHSKP